MVNQFIVESAEPLRGTLYYSASDRAFDYELQDVDDLSGLVGEAGTTSLVADTLQLEVAIDTKCVLFVWGYLPAESWRPMKMKLPDAKPGRVIAMVAGPPLEAGISVPIARGHWEAFFDESRGLVRVTRDHEVTESLVEIANGVHVGLNGASLSSFWLLPNFVK